VTRVLITGATGFIGAQVARAALGAGSDVYALSREPSDTWRLREIVDEIRFVRADLRNADAVASAVRAAMPEICIHAAWYAEPGDYLAAAENLEHTTATWQLAVSAANAGCRRFVGIGTCFEYDTTVGCLSEATALLPRSLYAASKVAAYVVIEQLAAQYRMESAWARLFYQYGPFEDERRLVPVIIQALLRDQPANLTSGDQIRDYLHVEDVARAVWSLASQGDPGVVNIGSGTPVTVREIGLILGDLLDRRDLLDFGAVASRPDDPPVVCAVNRRLVEGYGWRPLHTLPEGLATTVDWWRARLNRQSTEDGPRHEP
jgi:nucleoside-diphosphate-sugar epimerase